MLKMGPFLLRNGYGLERSTRYEKKSDPLQKSGDRDAQNPFIRAETLKLTLPSIIARGFQLG